MVLIGEFSIENDCGCINVLYRRRAKRRITLSEKTCRQIIDEINERIEVVNNITIRENLKGTMKANLRGSIFE